LLAAPPSAETLKACAAISGDAATPIGAALTGIASAAARTDPKTAEREFNALFIGLGRGELLPYASHYLTGHLNDRPLA
ncbi:molecular chaperone TorD family protein, partial [Escherichia coli]|uniref:molecular chaperone TorD family protein n=1 Tax=Escherichia coli TaxID=562 RepID=UPI001412E409